MFGVSELEVLLGGFLLGGGSSWSLLARPSVPCRLLIGGGFVSSGLHDDFKLIIYP